jgi:preprotein translocase subunit SecG
MEIILRVFQVFLAVGLIGVVLLQRSEGGGLGIGSSGGAGSFMSVRGTANFLTRVTAILAALFMITCLTLALLAKPNTAPKSIFDSSTPSSTITVPPVPAPAVPTPTTPPVSEAPLLPVPVPGEGVTTTPPQALSPTPPAAPATVAPAPAPAPLPEAAAPAAPDASATPAAKAKPKKTPKTGTAHTTGQ